MITADLHTHTHHSHGEDSPEAMLAAARARGIELYGFTEHSPRPLAYTYTREYRDRLTAEFPLYVREVRELQARYPGQVLLGMEMDWFDKDVDFVTAACKAYDFDYLIGSVHFLDTWGYDDRQEDWISVRKAGQERFYAQYFAIMERMVRSRLFNIVAHMDLIKIFSVDTFRQWIARPESLELVGGVMRAIKEMGMAMEISSAGLRKPCAEIYPGPAIMGLARDAGVDITFASDAHNVRDVASHFDQLEAYARSYGFARSVWFCRGERHERPF